jgi:hypothetical protein
MQNEQNWPHWQKLFIVLVMQFQKLAKMRLFRNGLTIVRFFNFCHSKKIHTTFSFSKQYKVIAFIYLTN